MDTATLPKSNIESLHGSRLSSESGPSDVDALFDEIERQELNSDLQHPQHQTPDEFDKLDGAKENKKNSKLLLVGSAITLIIVCVGAFLYISATPTVESAESARSAIEQPVSNAVESTIRPATVDSTSEAPILENPNDIAIDVTLSEGQIESSHNWEKILEIADQNSAVNTTQSAEPENQASMISGAISDFPKPETSDELKQIKYTAETAFAAAETISKRISNVETQQAAFGEKIESHQRAITQVANLIVRVQSEQKVISNELASVRTQLYKNESSIKGIEAKATQLQDAINSRSDSALPSRNEQTEIVSDVHQIRPGVGIANVSAPLNSKPASEEAERNTAVITLNNGSKEIVQQRQEVTLKTFTLLAIVKDKAIIKDASGKLYPIELGAKYKSLGSVTRLDKDKMEAVGMFDNGTYWIIKAAQQ